MKISFATRFTNFTAAFPNIGIHFENREKWLSLSIQKKQFIAYKEIKCKFLLKEKSDFK